MNLSLVLTRHAMISEKVANTAAPKRTTSTTIPMEIGFSTMSTPIIKAKTYTIAA
jgi:hypothetical protein